MGHVPQTPQNSLLDELAKILIRFRFVLLLGAVALIVLAFGPAARLRFDQSIESLYAQDDPHLAAYLDSKEWFLGDEFILVAYADPDLLLEDRPQMSPEAAQRLRSFADSLSQVPGIVEDTTQHLADALQFPYRRERVLEMVERVLVGSDRETTAVVLQLDRSEENSVPLGETIDQVRALADAHDPPAYVVGEPVQVHDMFQYAESDGQMLFLVSLGLLGVVILLLFRSLRWMLLPLAVVVAAIIWTRAILVLSGMRLSMVSSMLNSLLTIIGIATVTHVAVHYRDLRRDRLRADALRQTIVELGPPIFWTCATTAAGFAALLSSQITPARSFGLMMSLGTFMVLAAAASLLPGGMLLGRFDSDPRSTPAEPLLLKGLGRMIVWVDRNPLGLTLGFASVVALTAAGFWRLELETDFSKNFRRQTPIVQALDFVETRLGGAGTWEVNFAAPKELSPEFLDRVRSLAQELREIRNDGEVHLTKVVALTDGLDMIPRIPIIAGTVQARLRLLDRQQPEFIPGLYNPETGRMRIVLRARERQPSETKLELIDKVETVTRREFPDAQTTGLFVLLTYLIESLLRDQLVSLILATVGIGTMISIAYGSIRIGLASLIPNLFPIVVVVGTMGWIGLPINIATAMIASVSMGLTVDSSIHYISGYRRARRRGLGQIEAFQDTHRSVGRALVFANLALVIGFCVLTLSHFIPLIHFGILVSVAMLGGLIGNLLLLPLLLRWVDG